jgi:hypothetical protein
MPLCKIDLIGIVRMFNYEIKAQEKVAFSKNAEW